MANQSVTSCVLKYIAVQKGESHAAQPLISCRQSKYRTAN